MITIIFYTIFALLLIYHRVSLLISTIALITLLAIYTQWQGVSAATVFCWFITLSVIVPLNVKKWRRRILTAQLFNAYRQQMPSMSRTEREAIAAGTVTWEADLFRGKPNWHKLLSQSAPQLTAEEQAFLDGPVEQLCHMINDWDITHYHADLPPAMWAFIKEQGFFGLIIPKEFGGKGFSAYAHSQVIVKVSGLSITVSTTLSVPNSLGPAELLLHYGTEQQKNYYLPKLAKGLEIPCFALTSPEAGSDASSMTDHGIVCWGDFEGKKTLGIRLNFDKRYITLAPIATVIGLAFKLYDPDHLLGKKEDIGITCALIPRDTSGISIGRRHYPMSAPFQNGPIQGKNVFIPIDWIIGGAAQAGNGWRMLMECLAAGRAITLPSSSVGGAKISCYTSGAYARVRKQFNTPIGRFEGVEELLAQIAAYTYMADAARILTVGAIDQGAKPSVASAIIKYHTTELGRKVACDAMDIHGGKAICLGPHNYLGRGYESIPIAITVEGANVLTRNLIIFGQGAIRCHPYILAEMDAVRMTDTRLGLRAFDRAIMRHAGFTLSNVVRSLFLGLTGSRFVFAPSGKLKYYFQTATRFSSAFALLADASMMLVGANLKRKESLSARLGDILSYLYLLSASLKHFYDQGKQSEDLPVVCYVGDYCFHQIQQRFNDILNNFPNRAVALLLKRLIFPVGMHFSAPSDRLRHQVAQLLTSPTGTRDRLCSGAFIGTEQETVFTDIQQALVKAILAEPIEKIIRDAKHDGMLSGYTFAELLQSALDNKVISIEQYDIVQQAEVARRKVIMVDDFAAEALAHNATSDTTKREYVK